MSHVEEFRGAAINNEPRVNERIHVDQVRLVGPGGEQVGVVRVEDALRLAQESGLDLVEVAPNSNPPVAKLMDYGKFKYESAQKAREARRNQSNTVIKSIRIGLKIDGNDYQTKKGQAERFLNGGDKVKFDLRFKGREQSRPEQGVRLLRGLAEELSGLDLERFFATAVHGTAKLALAKLLKPFGIRLQRRKASSTPTLGVKTGSEGSELRLTTVYDGSPAQAAGLSAGDVLLAIDGLRVTPSALERLLCRRKAGDAISVHAFRRDELMEFAVRLGAAPRDRHKLVLKQADNALRKGWLQE